MSNRFRKLKLTQTLNHGFPINPSVPFPEESKSLFDCTMKAPLQSCSPGNHNVTTAWASKSNANGKNCSMYILWHAHPSRQTDSVWVVQHADIHVDFAFLKEIKY